MVLLGTTEPKFWPWLRAELGASGFAVQAKKLATLPPSPSAIEEAARSESAAIGVAPLEAGSGVEIWLVDPVTHKLAFRELILGLYQPNDAPDVIAVHVVETLRATLIELGQRRFDAPPPPPPVVAMAPRLPPRWTLGVGAGAAFSPGRLGSFGYLNLSLGWALTSRFSLLVDAALTPFSAELRGSEGAAAVDWRSAGAALRFCVTDPKGPFRIRSGAGAWLSVMTLRGQAAAPFENHRLSKVSAVPHVDLSVYFSLTDRLGIGADAAAGFAVPAVEVDFAGREQTTWGRPLWHGQLMLETSLD